MTKEQREELNKQIWALFEGQEDCPTGRFSSLDQIEDLSDDQILNYAAAWLQN